MHVRHNRSLIFLAACFSIISIQSYSQTESKRITLPNGWSLTPAGRNIPLGDLPLNIAVSSSKKFLAVTNNGQSRQSLQLIDVQSQKTLADVTIAKSWVGLAFSADDKFLYASGGNDNWILRYAITENSLVVRDTIVLGPKWPEKISPAGLALNEKRNMLYVVTKENNSLYVINSLTKAVTKQFSLGGEGYMCILSSDNRELYISCWGSDSVKVFDIEKETFTHSFAVGDNPNDLCITQNGTFLYVANANDNSVSVIDLKKQRVIETLNAALYPNAPSGSTTNSVALSEDEKTLYIANADNNCLAVFDVHTPGSSKSLGFIPTGWYPTSVRVVGKNIFVTNGKGLSSMANPYGPNPTGRRQKVAYQHDDSSKPMGVQYIAGLFRGTLSVIPVPS